jgi:ornithine cyclodeaminase
MRYLNEQHVQSIQTGWDELIKEIGKTVEIMNRGDYAQPVKPYLRYRNQQNRIIAMPAYVGGDVNIAGIKWIASFPQNIKNGLPRAHSVVVLNDADTGVPVCIFNTALISILRTCAVSGLMIKEYLEARPSYRLNVGIIGWGPVGRHHYQMCKTVLGDRIDKILLFDIITDMLYQSLPDDPRVVACDNWENVFESSDIFITCTVSSSRYIDRRPKTGSLLLNVSLRDYQPSILDYTKAIVVDDWDEVCRENTDIEYFHLHYGLKSSQVKSIRDVVCAKYFHMLSPGEPIFFNPMGMAVFDVAVAKLFFTRAVSGNVGIEL